MKLFEIPDVASLKIPSHYDVSFDTDVIEISSGGCVGHLSFHAKSDQGLTLSVPRAHAIEVACRFTDNHFLSKLPRGAEVMGVAWSKIGDTQNVRCAICHHDETASWSATGLFLDESSDSIAIMSSTGPDETSFAMIEAILEGLSLSPPSGE